MIISTRAVDAGGEAKKETDIMKHLTHAEWEALRRAWEAGNDEGQGSAFGEDTDTPRQAILREGFDVLAVDADGTAVAHTKHKHYYLVCTTIGPWGVDVTITARELFGDELSVQA